jgi:hypothetical protein
VAQTRAGFRRRRDCMETLRSNNRCRQSRRSFLAATSVQGPISTKFGVRFRVGFDFNSGHIFASH